MLPHSATVTMREACLKMARHGGIWFYGNPEDSNSDPLQNSQPPADPTAELAAELESLKAEGSILSGVNL